MFKKCIIGLVLALMCSLFVPSNVYAAGVYNSTNTKFYTMTGYDTPSKIRAYYDTQTQHSYGISTTIGISSSKTNTLTASGSVSYGVDAYFVKLSYQVGVSSSESETISTSQSWTVPASQNSGLYRIEAVFPVSKIQFNSFEVDTGDKIYDECFTISYMPETDRSYKRLYRYANVG